MTSVNLLKYKKANAKLKREIKIAKRKSIYRFTSTINPSTPIEQVWKNVRSFTGYKTKHTNQCLTSNYNPNIILTNKADIANEMANFWSDCSSDRNFPFEYCQAKNTLLETPISFNPI